MKNMNLTAKVLYKVLQFHFPLWLHVWAVHVRVEEYNGKRQDEDGIWVPKLTHHPRVADAVALTECK